MSERDGRGEFSEIEIELEKWAANRKLEVEVGFQGFKQMIQAQGENR